MKKLLLSLTFIAMLTGLAEAQQISDARVADFVQAGKIRVGVHSVMYKKDPQTGEPKGAGVGIILLDIARALGERIGADIVPVGFPTIPEMLTCVTSGACDMGFMGPDPSRTGVRLLAPHSPIGLHPSGAGGLFDSTPCGCGSTGRSHRGRQGSRLDVDLEPNPQTRPTGLRRDSGPHFRAPAFRTGGRVCLNTRRASGVLNKASRFAGAGRVLRCQPPWHRGPEGSRRAPRLHQRIYRTSHGLGIGAARDRPCRLARIQGGTHRLKIRAAVGHWGRSALGQKRKGSR